MKQFVLSAIALAALVACAPQQSAELTQEELVARGEYLVNNIGGCNDCHTPMTPQGPDMTHALQGATLGFAPTVPIPWAPVAPPPRIGIRATRANCCAIGRTWRSA